MKIEALERAVMQALIFEIVVGLALLVLMFWATYYVIKAGVRDGIKESGLRPQQGQRSSPPPGFRWELVRDVKAMDDMRAER